MLQERIVSRSEDSGLEIPFIEDFLCYRYELWVDLEIQD
jgi:hypothetical protein